MRVAVADDNSRCLRAQRVHPDALDGRGLQIVDSLASRWGQPPGAIGKTLWFELTHPA